MCVLVFVRFTTYIGRILDKEGINASYRPRCVLGKPHGA